MSLYKHIVCCLDFSDRSQTAFLASARLARHENADLSLVHVASPHAPLLPGMTKKEGAKLDPGQKAARLRSYIEENYLSNLPEGQECRIELRQGHPSVEILAYLNECEADLVVVGAEGFSGAKLILLGSVAKEISRKAPCSCLLVR